MLFQRGSEAEQMQSRYISESQNLPFSCRDTFSLVDNVNDRDTSLARNVIVREGQKQNRRSLNSFLNLKTTSAPAEPEQIEVSMSL